MIQQPLRLILASFLLLILSGSSIYAQTGCVGVDLDLECSATLNEDALQQWNEANMEMIRACSEVACSDAVVTSDFDLASNYIVACGLAGSITVTYTATGCGEEMHSSQASATIIDSTLPVVTCNPEDVTIECASAETLATELLAWNAANITLLEECSVDECSNQVVVSSNYEGTLLGCGNDGNVAYTITDDCGNITEITASFSITSSEVMEEEEMEEEEMEEEGEMEEEEMNNNGCGAVGGVFITIGTDTTEVTVCVGDDISDAVYAKVWEEEGDASRYLITDEDGTILRIESGIRFEFEGTGTGTNFIYHLSTVGNVTGVSVGSNISDINGCHELSNSIRVNKIDDGDQCGCAMSVSLGNNTVICEGDELTIDAEVFNSNVCTIVCEIENNKTLVEWDMDECFSITDGVSNKDFSELAPEFPNDDDCVGVTATPVNVEGGMHSCTIPKDGLGGRAMCFSGSKKCYWKDDSPDALKFSVTLSPEASSTISGLQFYESAPERFQWYNPDFSEDVDEGPNNFPRFYGLRVTVDGEEIFQENDIPTTNDWTLEEFDFSGNDAFRVEDTTTFVFELLAYCPSWENAITYAWDLDNIQLLGGCCEKDTTITAVDYVWSTGETTESITVSPTEDTEYSVTVTDCMGCVATKTLPLRVNDPVTADLGDDISVCRDNLPVTLSHSVEGIDTRHPRVEWSTGEVGESIQVTEPGTYTVTVTDGLACSDTDEIVVSINDPESLNLPDDIDPVCEGSTIDLTTLEPSNQGGGEWTNSAGEIVSNVGAGTYTYTFSDSNGCVSSDQVTITEDNFDFTVDDQGPICVDEDFDFSTIVPDGVDGDRWSVDDLGDGNFRFNGTNANGCTASDEFRVSVDNFSFELPDPPVLCEGEVYMLSNEEPDAYPGGTWTDMDGNVVEEAIPGMFTYTVSNDNGCTASDKITFVMTDFMVMQIPDDSVCWGDSLLLSDLEFPEQSGGFWKDLNNNVVTYGEQDTRYRYHFFDVVGQCTHIVDVRIHEMDCGLGCDGFSISVDSPSDICSDESIDLTSLEREGSSGGTWTNSDGETVSSGGPGTYHYSYTNADGCSDSVEITIGAMDCTDPCESFRVDIAEPDPICDDATIDLDGLVPEPGRGGSWEDSDGNDVGIVGPGTYTYSVVTNDGCSAIVVITVAGMDCTDPCESFRVDIDDPDAICNDATIDLDALVPEQGRGGSWEDSDGNDVDVVGPGTYTYSVATSDGCSAIVVITVPGMDCTVDPCDDHVTSIDLGGDREICEDEFPFKIALGLSCDEIATLSVDAGAVRVEGDTICLNADEQYVITITDTDGNSVSESILLTSIDCSDPSTPCDDGNPNTENDIQIDECNCCGTPITGQVIYVDGDAAGATNGTSWTDALNDLQEAISIAEAGQEIWVADGTYIPTQDGDRDVYFEIPSGVDLYGGFAGTEENICQRDFTAVRTILSGDLNGDDKSHFSNLFPLELLFESTEENSHNVIRNTNVSDDITIDGIAIVGGSADSGDNAGGGAMQFNNVQDATIELNNVLMATNQGTGLGGAMRVSAGDGTLLTVKMDRVIFLQNEVTGPALSKGAGVFFSGVNGEMDVEITNNAFIQNRAGDRGGAVSTDGDVDISYTNSLFTGNRADRGGAVFENNANSKSIYTNNTFYINHADIDGGAIVNFDDFGNNTSEARNCIYFGNVVIADGGPAFSNEGPSNNFTFQNCMFSELALAVIEMRAAGTVDAGGNQFAVSDVLFTDPLNADFTLQSNSPAINAGDNSFVILAQDLSGNERIQDDIVDLGALESGENGACFTDIFEIAAAAELVQAEYEVLEQFVAEEEEIVPFAEAEVVTYPNPTTDVVNVIINKSKEDDEVTMSLFDTAGGATPIENNIVDQNGMQVTYSIPVKDLRGGVYILKTQIGRFTINKRVIVIK